MEIERSERGTELATAEVVEWVGVFHSSVRLVTMPGAVVAVRRLERKEAAKVISDPDTE